MAATASVSVAPDCRAAATAFLTSSPPRPPYAWRNRHRHASRRRRPPSGVDVLTHPRDVHAQSVDHIRHRRQGRRRSPGSRRRRPGLQRASRPRTARARGAACQHRRHEARHACGCRKHDGASSRVALVWHRGRAAAGFEDLGDFVLHEQRDVARDLAKRIVWTPQAATSAARRSRWACQGASGTARSSSRASACSTATPCVPSAASVPAAPPNCRTIACSYAVAQLLQLRVTAPSHDAALRPKVVGAAGCSSVRPSITLPACASARPGRDHARAASDGFVESTPLECRGPVRYQDVLAGGPQMDVAGRIRIGGLDARLERLDQRDRCVASERPGDDGVQIQAIVARGTADRLGGTPWHEPGARFCAREGGFEVDHRLQKSAIGEGRRQRLGRRKAVDQVRAHAGDPMRDSRRQRSKKTVSHRPAGGCRTPTRRQPGARRSVARRDSGTRASTGSSASIGSPAK